MPLAAAESLVTAAELHLACGALFAAVFLWRWVGLIDPAAAHGTPGFRVLVFPGVAILWPLFALRLVRGMKEPPDEWTAHRGATRRARRHSEAEVLP